MISTPDRRRALELVEEAMAQGARQEKACELMGISARTYQRWTREGGIEPDGRPEASRPAPANRLSEAERAHIVAVCNRPEVAVCNRPEYASLPPCQIVPALADRGEYLASESTFYRVLREAGLANRRGRAKPPQRRAKPKNYCATGPNQVWSWDITYLASAIRGVFYRLYLVLDIYSRKVVGWEIHERETAGSRGLVQPACGEQRQSVFRKPVPDDEVHPGLAAGALRGPVCVPAVGTWVCDLVQRKSSAQCH